MKSYLVNSPSSSLNSPEKNCLASNEPINKNNNVRTPKLEIDDSEANTVESNDLSFFHVLINLKTLTNLNALNTEIPVLSSYIPSSTKPIITINASNTLNPS